MKPVKIFQSRRSQRIILLACALATALLLFLSVHNTTAPVIDLEYADTSIRIAADRSWTFFPGDCVNLSWEMEGIQSLYINEYGRIGRDKMVFCPAVNATSPVIEVTAQNGIYRRLELEIQHLPDLLFYLLGFMGVLGSGLLSLYFLKRYKLDGPAPINSFLIVLLLLLVLGGAIRLSPVRQPLIDKDNGNVAVRFWAERDRIIFPHECLGVGWSVSGAQAIAFDGQDVTGAGNPGNARHCAGDGLAATLEVISDDGLSSRYTLDIESLFPDSQQPPIFFFWSLLVLTFSLILFVSLVGPTILASRPNRITPDFVAAIGCLLFVIALYAPAGFDSIAHWENQIVHGYWEGGPPGFFGSWVVSRFTGLVNRILSYLISSETFIGYHLVNCLMLAGTVAAVYGILRLLGITPLFAFLVAVFFIAYPVNPMQLSLRSMLLNLSRLSLVAAIYFMLEFKWAPRRHALVGCWLALMYNVSTYETGYPLILVVPLLWWLTRSTTYRHNVILTIMWYLIPFFKAAYMVLLYMTGRDFYQSGLLSGGSQTQGTIRDISAAVIEATRKVIAYSFVEGWQDAVKSIEGNLWWGSILILLALAGGVAWYHVRQSDNSQWPTTRDIGRSVLIGFLLVPVSAVALLWLPLYAGDLWRPYLYVPFGASIALVGFVLAVTTPIRNLEHRKLVLIAVCLALLIPALSRLQLQGRGFVESADRKARILHRVLEIAPSVEPTTQLLIVTPMENEALKQLGIFEFIHWDMINSAFYVLYGDGAPDRAYFCLSWRICSTREGEETIFNSETPGELLQRTLVFKLTEDLAIELVNDPVEKLALDIEVYYDPGLLFDPDASLPPRAETMLGPALRR